jgi:hypothetical protein
VGREVVQVVALVNARMCPHVVAEVLDDKEAPAVAHYILSMPAHLISRPNAMKACDRNM